MLRLKRGADQAEGGAVPTAAVNGIEIYYQRSGSGPPTLFLNGSGATLAATGMMLTPFIEHFDVLAHDQRGMGRTAVPPGPYSMADYAADAAALLDHVGWQTCRVVGISFGGMVAQELAVTYPERIERLALLCTSPGGRGGSSYPLHELEDLAPDERAALTPQLLDTRFTANWLLSHPGDRMLAEAMNMRPTPAGAEERRGISEQLGARRHHDVFDRLHRISCPTLVACGSSDGIAPASNSRMIAGQIPDADLRVFEGGHIFFGQDPTALPEIIGFLTRR
jgi:3-oxoadipate enol-lactonase